MARSAEPIKQPVIGILLNVREEAAQVQLRVSYLVSNASWRPKYDVRVSSKERTMEVREGLPRPPLSLCRSATLVWCSRQLEKTGRSTLTPTSSELSGSVLVQGGGPPVLVHSQAQYWWICPKAGDSQAEPHTKCS